MTVSIYSDPNMSRWEQLVLALAAIIEGAVSLLCVLWPWPHLAVDGLSLDAQRWYLERAGFREFSRKKQGEGAEAE